MNPNYHIIACSKTDRGRRRPRNEDVCLADTDRYVFMVADGMGGKAGGDVASALFLEAVKEVFTKPGNFLSVECQAMIESAFSLANNKILAHVTLNPHHSGMGCTAELLVFCKDHYLVGHVGDSRTYLFRDAKLSQLTHDHSLVQEQLELGLITRDQAEKSLLRNVLLRAVGVEANVTVDIIGGRIEPGDIFLLCTDGLPGMVQYDAILSVLAYQAPLSLKADMLIDMANDAGGHDNISVTLVERAS
jgi:protein phosphatase